MKGRRADRRAPALRLLGGSRLPPYWSAALVLLGDGRAGAPREVGLARLRQGAVLDGPDALLEGTGRLVRHVKLRSSEELAGRRAALRRLLTTAAGIG